MLKCHLNKCDSLSDLGLPYEETGNVQLHCHYAKNRDVIVIKVGAGSRWKLS